MAFFVFILCTLEGPYVHAYVYITSKYKFYGLFTGPFILAKGMICYTVHIQLSKYLFEKCLQFGTL